jgi:hypothetical protein
MMSEMTGSQIAVAVVTPIAVFEIWKNYERNAPTLAELRNANPKDFDLRQKLKDANMTIGTGAIIVGGVFAYQTKDPSMLIIILTILFVLSFWRYAILNAPNSETI